MERLKLVNVLILALFFLHLINENKHHRVTNKINNWNKYLSPTVNNRCRDWYPKSWPILSSRIECVLCWTIKSDDFISWQNRPIFVWQTTDFCWQILLADKIDRFYPSSDIAFSVCQLYDVRWWQPAPPLVKLLKSGHGRGLTTDPRSAETTSASLAAESTQRSAAVRGDCTSQAAGVVQSGRSVNGLHSGSSRATGVVRRSHAVQSYTAPSQVLTIIWFIDMMDGLIH